MAADDLKGPPPGEFVGFHRYADDTPREPEADECAAPDETIVEEPGLPLEPPVPVRRGTGRRGAGRPGITGFAIGGVLGSLAIVATVMLSRPAPRPVVGSPDRAVAPVAAQPAPARADAAPPAPAPQPAQMALQTEPPPTPAAPPAVAQEPEPPRLSIPLPERAAIVAPPPRETVVTAQAEAPSVQSVASDAAAVAPPVGPWFACRNAPSLALQMVCRDRGLATVDLKMKHAYAAALAAGVPAEALARDQEDWLEVREAAAHHSKRAVADVYYQRIGELRRIARTGR